MLLYMITFLLISSSSICAMDVRSLLSESRLLLASIARNETRGVPAIHEIYLLHQQLLAHRDNLSHKQEVAVTLDQLATKYHEIRVDLAVKSLGDILD